MPVSQKPFLSVEEIAVRLGVCGEMVRREFRRGKLKGIKIGQRLRFSEENFEEYVKQQAPVQVPLQGNTTNKR